MKSELYAVVVLVRELDLRTFIIAWFLSTPFGFLLWVSAWKTYGSGNGHITAIVGTTALLSWCFWHRGLYDGWIERMFLKRFKLCIVSGMAGTGNARTSRDSCQL